MTCNCSKENKEQDNECPEGQHFDVAQGKCVAKEAFGDAPESQKADEAESEVDTGDVQKVENQECPPGHAYDSETEQCMPVSPEVPEIAGTEDT